MRTILILSIFFLVGCGPQRFEQLREPDPLPSFYVPEKIRVALVLGGGGVRGTAHVGVIEELEAAGIPIDLIVGCSAGSMVGALYADNPNVEAIKCAVWSLRSDTLFDVNLLECRYGLSQGQTMHRVLDKHLHAECFSDLKIPLVVVATDLHSGELVPIGSGDLVKAVQSSCSMPFFFCPREHMGRVLVDGGVINPVPVKVARDLGADLVIAVDLCELLPRTFPANLFQIANRSAEIAFMWQNEVCTRNADVTIRPKTCGVGTFNDKMKWEIYESGKRAAREKIPLIQRLVSELPKHEEAPCGWRQVHLNCYMPCIYQDQ